MIRPVEVRPLARYRIWLRYQDGTEGEVDLSHLAGKGVFTVWEQESVFAGVTLGPHGQIEWPGEVDLCPDAIYLRLTGKRPEGGSLPARALGMVTEWASLHQRELLAAWERASRLQPPGKIEPLP
jgi:hypothetical protein